MGSVAESVTPKAAKKKAASSSTFLRVINYSALRLLSLFVTVVIGIYLTIMIANMGGYVDQMMKAEIQERITMQIAANPAYKEMDPGTRSELTQQRIQSEIERLHLD